MEARYVVGSDEVELRRRCPEHGQTSTVVSTDPDFFVGALELAHRDRPPSRRGLIIELLDGCNMRCPTCIASSAPELEGLRHPSIVARQLSQIPEDARPHALLLSGGEPTVHPEFDRFLRLVESHEVARRILITNGVRLGEDGDLAERLSSAPKPWEVYLQFDSLRPNVLRDIRGDDLAAVRVAALDALDAAGIATTLVCVIKRGQNLDELQSLIDFAATTRCVAGLQFQPIRNAGRLENYTTALHACDLSDVLRELRGGSPSPRLAPHPASPLSVAVGYLDKGSGEWLDEPLGEAGLFAETALQPATRLRLSVLEYADSTNWSSLKAASSPLNVLQRDGRLLPVDDHFITEVTTLAIPRAS